MKSQSEYIENIFDSIKLILKEHKPKKIFLITGKNSFEISGAKNKITKTLKNYETIIFNDFDVNPKIEDIYKGVNIIKQHRPDFIISIGGGSVIDMGKLINILANQKIYSILDIIMNSNLISSESFAPLLAIPTTAGTGSEATHFAVAYINKEKFSVAHHFMRPEFVILDESLSYNFPKNIAASAAFDALCQSIESFWSVNSTLESKKYATKAIELILLNVESAINDSNLKAKNSLIKAANLSGKAINISKTTAPHAISYPITSFFNVPHGHAVALTLGKFFILNIDNLEKNILDSRGPFYLNEIMNTLFSLFDCDNAKSCHDYWYSLVNLLGLETDIKKLGINSIKDIDIIIENINFERMGNHPVNITHIELKKMLQKMIN
jgi:alcohol dehydrogenase